MEGCSTCGGQAIFVSFLASTLVWVFCGSEGEASGSGVGVTQTLTSVYSSTPRQNGFVDKTHSTRCQAYLNGIHMETAATTVAYPPFQLHQSHWDKQLTISAGS